MSAGGNIAIDTPEQVTIDYPVAGLGSRFLALLLDSVIQYAAALVVMVGAAFLIPGIARGRTAPVPVSPAWIVAFLIVFFYLLYAGYFILFELLWRGQTPGKRALKIRVIQQDGRALTVFGALTRNLLRGLDFLPAGYAAGALCMALNHRAQRLGDFAAATIVVHERGATPWLLPRPATAAATLPTAGLALDDLKLIEAFLARRLQLDTALREQTAARVIAHLCRRLDTPAPSPGEEERFLESTASSLRSSLRFKGQDSV